MENYQKIKEILDYFTSKNKSFTWDIGTDIYKTWKRMIENSNKFLKQENKIMINY
ncbi:MAG: hypothetical protein K2K73_01115 [Ureaplasma sp.]|nr:hypothetical protein [Ureaplasma sp.]